MLEVISTYILSLFPEGFKPADMFHALFYLVGVALILAALIRLIRSRKFFAAMKDEHLCQSMEQDFDKAMPMRKNSIKFGEQYVFMKRSGRILKYSEITQVYQYIHKTNGVEDQRLLKYVDTKGKTRKMCKLDLRGKSDIELTTIIALLLKKNPDIKVGYR